MSKYISSWINEVIVRLANCGVVGKTRTLKFVPRKKDSGKCLAYRDCAKCGKKNAVVFQAVEDCHVFLTACPVCHQFAYHTTTGPATEAHSTKEGQDELVMKVLCAGTTVKGEPCKNSPLSVSSFCNHHLDQDPDWQKEEPVVEPTTEEEVVKAPTQETRF